MYFDSIQALWSMGGHGSYVWIAYGVSLSIMLLSKIYPLKSWGACDIDYSWQIPGIIHWLKKNGIKKK